MHEGALVGIKVLDFTRVLAGPLATMMLGDLGADVIKVEHVKRGDDTRAWGPPYAGAPSDGMSAYYLSVNRNKRSISLNLKHPDGQKIARQLAQRSQVLVENFKVGQMTKFGLDYATLQNVHPSLVYCSITGFGQDSPYSQRPGYDYVIQAMSGLMSITGAPEVEGEKVGVAIADVLAGLNAVSAILAALRHAETTGVGQHIDIGLLNTQLAALVNVASNYLVSDNVPQRHGHQHPNIVPYQTFQASDGRFVCAVGNDRQFRALCELIGQGAWADDERFATNSARLAHRDTLVALLDEIFAQNNADVWVKRLLEAGIPAGRLQNVAQALEDEHTASQAMLEQWALGNGTMTRGLGSPLRMSETPPETRLPPPQHGEHTAEILADVLCYSVDEIAKLKQDGVI
jgi:crotonobetainyl-CoA:carnitine CoA-transferase CaiB-like acyl-CoA transferase